ncbi:MAG: hypothetical protein ACO1TE_26100 [Prosthecobacter sp.]
MDSLPSWILVIAAGFLLGAAVDRFRLRHFWRRRCTGALWRRRFPAAPKADIRAFLDLLVSAFAFRASRRLSFAPEDRIMAIHEALYPFPKVQADNMELETFVSDIRARFGVDLTPMWREDITLGELFSHATRGA